MLRRVVPGYFDTYILSFWCCRFPILSFCVSLKDYLRLKRETSPRKTHDRFAFCNFLFTFFVVVVINGTPLILTSLCRPPLEKGLKTFSLICLLFIYLFIYLFISKHVCVTLIALISHKKWKIEKWKIEFSFLKLCFSLVRSINCIFSQINVSVRLWSGFSNFELWNVE